MTYAGGKGRLWQDIVSLMPPHDVYIETHLGGGAVIRNKKPAGTNIGIDLDPEVIEIAKNWDLPNFSIIEGDATNFLSTFSFKGRELVYIDPPYIASTKKYRRYYKCEYSDDQHVELLAIALKLPCCVMISGYPHPIYDRALSSWTSTELTNISHSGPRVERLWANFDFSGDLHDYSVIGGSFRERERIKRKAARWVDRLERLPVLERRAVISAMIEHSNDTILIDRLVTSKQQQVSV